MTSDRPDWIAPLLWHRDQTGHCHEEWCVSEPGSVLVCMDCMTILVVWMTREAT